MRSSGGRAIAASTAVTQARELTPPSSQSFTASIPLRRMNRKPRRRNREPLQIEPPARLAFRLIMRTLARVRLVRLQEGRESARLRSQPRCRMLRCTPALRARILALPTRPAFSSRGIGAATDRQRSADPRPLIGCHAASRLTGAGRCELGWLAHIASRERVSHSGLGPVR